MNFKISVSLFLISSLLILSNNVSVASVVQLGLPGMVWEIWVGWGHVGQPSVMLFHHFWGKLEDVFFVFVLIIRNSMVKHGIFSDF